MGVVFVAYGQAAIASVTAAYHQLRRHSALPITIVGATSPVLPGAQFVKFDAETTGRWAKLNLDTLSPYFHTLYLDADTRVHSNDIMTGYKILEDGYDLVMTHSENQDGEFLAHSTPADRALTVTALSNPQPLQLQAGVMWINKNDRTRALWVAWRDEWQRERGQDQGALLRALDRAPVKLWLMGLAWNSRHGEIIEHHFGGAR